MTKLLKISFTILLIIIIGEVGYLIYVQNLFPPPTTSFKKGPSFVPSPSPGDSIMAMTYELTAKEKRSALTRKKMIDEGTLFSSIVTDKLRTTLVLIKIQNEPRAVHLTVKNGEEDTITYFYNEPYIDRIKVFEFVEGEERDIGLADLKPGDQIEMELVFDSLKPASDIISLKIIKI